ncbi:SGNH/GDSL hydrolase family protein [Vagococcus elongatus]|uniref:SGNH/GDSL hydrolase family protein n=1 Tax=Vagococcus elongatus TaxID=180344 RepID=UPI0014777AD3|nr:GDSL-type esterase/lipase family protein [Vagococcus elongatus]
MTKIILFGDSITAGWNEEGITDALTSKVAAIFPEDHIINAGIPGDTTSDGLKRLEAHVLRYQPDIVTLFFGANDVAIDRLISLNKYLANMVDIIEKIGPEKVILFSAPYTKQAIRKFDRPLSRCRKFSDGLAELAEEKGLPFVNVLDEMINSERADEWLQEDGLHFSDYGYQRLGELFTQKIMEKKRELNND